MSKKPSHSAYIVIDPPQHSDTTKPTWIEIGAVWPHKNGKGFDVAVPGGMVIINCGVGRVVNRIVCIEQKDTAPKQTH